MTNLGITIGLGLICGGSVCLLIYALIKDAPHFIEIRKDSMKTKRMILLRQLNISQEIARSRAKDLIFILDAYGSVHDEAILHDALIRYCNNTIKISEILQKLYKYPGLSFDAEYIINIEMAVDFVWASRHSARKCLIDELKKVLNENKTMVKEI